MAVFKADVLNDLVIQHRVETVMEFGCGDGQQLALASYPRYLGIDVSPTIIERCRTRFAGDPTKHFFLASDRKDWPWDTGDLVLSLDVVFHLVEDGTYESYMRDLVEATRGLLAVYSSNEEVPGRAPHVRHRRFTDWIAANAPHLGLLRHVPNPYPSAIGAEDEERSFCDFWIYAVEEWFG